MLVAMSEAEDILGKAFSLFQSMADDAGYPDRSIAGTGFTGCKHTGTAEATGALPAFVRPEPMSDIDVRKAPRFGPL